MPNLTLYQIESELGQLLDLREEIEALPDHSPDSLVAIDAEIASYFTREVRKVDGICESVAAVRSAAEAVEQEVERLSARAKALRTTEKRIKDNALYAMQLHGVKKLETPTHSLRVQANGGNAPIEASIDVLPAQYIRVTASMPGDIWEQFNQQFDMTNVCVGKAEPNSDAIRSALAQSVVCDQCQGKCIDASRVGTAVAVIDCAKCGGKGTVPATVPGARIGERGVHLRVR